jgi:hypothetical protein
VLGQFPPPEASPPDEGPSTSLGATLQPQVFGGLAAGLVVILTVTVLVLLWPAREPIRTSLPAALPSTSPTPSARSSAPLAKRLVDTRKPKAAIQIFNTREGVCDKTFAVNVNAYIVKGLITKGSATLSLPGERTSRTYPLVLVEGDFSRLISAIPTKKTARLQVYLKGPHGEVTEWHDITQRCPGEPSSQEELKPYGNAKMFQGLRKISFKKLDFDFSFRFEMDSLKYASSPNKPRPSASPTQRDSDSSPREKDSDERR